MLMFHDSKEMHKIALTMIIRMLKIVNSVVPAVSEEGALFGGGGRGGGA
jgi:hypothetical protein